MESYHLFAWGANSHGQLCLGYCSEQQVIPEEIDLSKTNIIPSDIVKIVGGAGHTLVLTKSGKIYACGWNNKGQRGIPQSQGMCNLRLINELQCTRIKDIACGWDSSVALTENGDVYIWGSNAFGQLGVNISDKYIDMPLKVDITSRVKKIVMGLRHTILLTEEGRLLVSGASSKFQLGIVDENNTAVRQLDTFLPGMEDVDDVACGQYFTIAVTKSGALYGWGSNKYGQLAANYSYVKEQRLPVQLNCQFGVLRKVQCGWTHAGVLTDEGKIFLWGRNTYGQLGCSNEFSCDPRILGHVDIIEQFCAGSEHNIALDSKGNVLTWGWNEHGNCANGNTENVWSPSKISISKDYKGVLIGSGAGHSFALMKKLI